MFKKQFLYFHLLLLCPILVLGQQLNKTKTVKILPVPAFGYSPETKTYVGAVSLFTFDFYHDSITRLSNAKMEFNYTWNKQMILECGWSLFSKNESWFTKGQIHYSKFPDFYYGLGSQTPEANKLPFGSNRFIFDVSVLKKTRPYLFTGLNLKYNRYWNVEPINTNAILFTELKNNYNIGLGYSVVKDSRNSLLSPTSGKYLHANTTYNVSQQNFWEFFLDLRYYKTWSDKYTLAGRFVSDMNTNTPPFYEYAIAGGDKFVRGYYFGRYRDRNLSTLQLEFRLPIFWRLGFAAFGGLSSLYSNPSTLNTTDLKYNVGGGLRFMVDKKDKTNLRIDYAVGSNNNTGFYVSFGESF